MTFPFQVDSTPRTPQQGLNSTLTHSYLTAVSCGCAEVVVLDCAGPMTGLRSSSGASTQTSTSIWRTMRLTWSRYAAWTTLVMLGCFSFECGIDRSWLISLCPVRWRIGPRRSLFTYFGVKALGLRGGAQSTGVWLCTSVVDGKLGWVSFLGRSKQILLCSGYRYFK